nr:DUF5994 family protein [Mycobacterium scrofulaceum]
MENRLQLKPYRSVSEHIDGAWWPRTTNLVDELPGLLASVSERLGPVVMVGYRRNGWQDTRRWRRSAATRSNCWRSPATSRPASS